MTTYKSNRENKIRVVVGDIFIPKKFSVWDDAVYMVVNTTGPGPTIVHLGGRRSGEVSTLDNRSMQRSFWVTYYNRF